MWKQFTVSSRSWAPSYAGHPIQREQNRTNKAKGQHTSPAQASTTLHNPQKPNSQRLSKPPHRPHPTRPKAEAPQKRKAKWPTHSGTHHNITTYQTRLSYSTTQIYEQIFYWLVGPNGPPYLFIRRSSLDPLQMPY